MSRHRFPLCPASGKIRYGERKDVKLVLRGAERDRSRARLLDVACSRREIRSYHCADCCGWHLTSQPARPMQLVPVTNLTEHLPQLTTRSIRRFVAPKGLAAGNAA
jgi:hypothetical protein